MTGTNIPCIPFPADSFVKHSYALWWNLEMADLLFTWFTYGSILSYVIL